MKVIPKKDLRKLITKYCDKDVTLDEVERLFEAFGDEWYIDYGKLRLFKENEERKKLWL